MPHIPVPESMPGIRALFAFRPETGNVLMQLVQTLLRGESTLTPGERELIASYVSRRNECCFCERSHSAAAMHLLDGNRKLVEQVKSDYRDAPIGDKMKALLTIAGKVQRDGRSVTEHDVADAKKEGATDVEIHDTVLIAAAFCMFNRYVDGLGAVTPEEGEAYDAMGAIMASKGYVRPL